MSTTTSRRPVPTAEQFVKKLRLESYSSVHLQSLLDEPYLEELVSDHSRRKLLGKKGAMKEISEAYGAARGVQRALRGLGCASTTGEGALILDVCSGFGYCALLLSYILPDARIKMLDKMEMSLAHIEGRNVSFQLMDLFAHDAARIVTDIVEDAKQDFVVATGIHLCGSLSPRLVSLACHLDCLDGLVVCPCCFSGSLGAHAKRESKRTGRENYEVLVETLAEMARNELHQAQLSGSTATVTFDTAMLTPVNGFVNVLKKQKGRLPSILPESEEDRKKHVFINPAIQKMLGMYRQQNKIK